ncbi:hypothetical protein V2S84_04825 [Azotobacter chroococcum]|nr:hypothetical protein [Azotobacter chroococcum]
MAVLDETALCGQRKQAAAQRQQIQSLDMLKRVFMHDVYFCFYCLGIKASAVTGLCHGFNLSMATLSG